MCDSCTVAGDYLSGAHSLLCVAGRKEAKGSISRDSRCNFRRAREGQPEQTKASAFSIRSSDEVPHKDAFPCRLTQPPPPALSFSRQSQPRTRAAAGLVRFPLQRSRSRAFQSKPVPAASRGLGKGARLLCGRLVGRPANRPACLPPLVPTFAWRCQPAQLHNGKLPFVGLGREERASVRPEPKFVVQKRDEKPTYYQQQQNFRVILSDLTVNEASG